MFFRNGFPRIRLKSGQKTLFSSSRLLKRGVFNKKRVKNSLLDTQKLSFWENRYFFLEKMSIFRKNSNFFHFFCKKLSKMLKNIKNCHFWTVFELLFFRVFRYTPIWNTDIFSLCSKIAQKGRKKAIFGHFWAHFLHGFWVFSGSELPPNPGLFTTSRLLG